MDDLKARRAAGETVCLRCGNFSTAMTCAMCNWADDVAYFQQKICQALKVPAEYLGYERPLANPMAFEEDYYLPATPDEPTCTRCGFQTCACEYLGCTDEPKVDCTLSHLAQAIFDTDPEVLAFVEEVAETRYSPCSTLSVEKRRLALDKAWQRDENGWATRALQRAAAIKNAL